MKRLLTPIGLFGLFYLISGTLLNIRMFVVEAWPTVMFFLLMLIGLVFIGLSFTKWNFKMKYLVQIILGLLPLAFIFWPRTSSYADSPTTAAISSKRELQNGDIIFQTSRSSQSKAIQLATKSKYSHMGIIYQINGQYYVYEAVQPVKLTKLNDWVTRGENSHYVVKRIKDSKKILTIENVERMKDLGEKFKGKNYDIYFEWSDDKIYCSELVWKIYKETLNIEIGNLQELREFDLTSETVKNKMKERYGDDIPLDEKVISPATMFESDKLVTVIEE